MCVVYRVVRCCIYIYIYIHIYIGDVCRVVVGICMWHIEW